MTDPDAVVIGAGPAGLMAAEVLAGAGFRVLVADAKPSFGRKLLMAGKSGLNLTKDEPFERFLAAFGEAAPRLEGMLRAFGPDQVQSWAEGLGQAVFTGSTGRVFPKVMKASPLLRAWLARLDGLGVERRTRWRWSGWDDAGVLVFDTPDGAARLVPRATVLALGGASWRRLGSDGAWAPLLDARGVALRPFAPANAGVSVAWSDHMRAHFGAPIKAARWSAGGMVSRGEVTLSVRGLEGGGLYALTPALRGGAPLWVDLMPDVAEAGLAERVAKAGNKARLARWLKSGLRLSPAKVALFFEGHREVARADWASAVKSVPVQAQGLRPQDEAISTAGGVAFSALNDGLELDALPGVYCAGEMLDWEAPTGGYLLTACLATGRHAGQAARAALSKGAP